MNTSESFDPRAASAEIDRAAARVRRARWWYVAAWAVMAVYSAAFYIGLMAYPERFEDLVIPAMLLVVAILGFMSWRQRMVSRGASRVETTVILSSICLGAVAAVVNESAVPDGLTVWAVLVGVLPAIPFAWLAWRAARR
ncbi:hypothetical protein [Glycomyces arizonensis]|uniref:hypothetical protein n=1 Tax=Glycomyces arizonensis TaxID=256035 RepID=UPI000426FBC3|nr:hypothetical protein [Glycomyces arizonensis]